jgi:hypothetical protein
MPLQLFNPPLRRLPCPAIGLDELIECGGGVEWMSVEHAFDETDNIGEANLAGQESRHGYLVGRVQHGARSASFPGYFVPELKRRKTIPISRFEVQCSYLHQVQLRGRAGEPVGVAKGILNG